jgi:O-antigen ligase
MGTGLGHYIPLLGYVGCWVMCLYALFGKPLWTFYYIIPLLPYRTLRDHFSDYPLGDYILTIMVLSILIGALLHGKRLPKSPLFPIWFLFGIYLYISMWIGTALGNAPAPLWSVDVNFATWKAYMLLPLLFVAAGMVVEDRRAVRTVLLVSALSLLLIDRAALLDSLSHTFRHFDEDKRDGGPLSFAGSNGLAAFLAQFAMFFWGVVQFVQRRKYKLLGLALVGITLFATMYTFSRASYIAVVAVTLLLGVLKDRKLIVIVAIFLFTWQTLVPTAVTERVTMTQDSNGNLEASAQERIDLWEEAKNSFLHSPIVGTGYATFQYRAHTDHLKDTHNWYVKVLTETGVLGMIFALAILQQMLSISWRLFRNSSGSSPPDPLYQGLGLGLLLAISSSIILNFFGDRWTYVEINGMLWVLVGTGIRALSLSATAPATELAPVQQPEAAVNPYLAYR